VEPRVTMTSTLSRTKSAASSSESRAERKSLGRGPFPPCGKFGFRDPPVFSAVRIDRIVLDSGWCPDCCRKWARLPVVHASGA
jgi:hypothetical protein